MLMSDVISQEELLELEPEELAGLLLQYLLSEQGAVHPGNVARHIAGEYAPASRARVERAVAEAWTWLEREGLLAPDPTQWGSGWSFVTRRGERLQSADGVKKYRHANLLPRNLLHPTISDRVWPDFLRGDYDSAVFKAYRAVEVAVREAGGFKKDDLGVSLMREAFKKNVGSLTDSGEPEGEQVALQHLFAGAIGRFKNPSSHRHREIEAHEAVEVIMTASHLMRIIDERAPKD